MKTCAAMERNIERVRAHVERSFTKGELDQCWEWTAFRTPQGYGHVNWRGGDGVHYGTGAHRVVYMLMRGSLTDGLTLDHLCRNRACVNPWHLEEVSREENFRRAQPHRKKKTHCKWGHELVGDNLYRLKSGYTACRQCRYDRTAKWARSESGQAYHREYTNAKERAL